MNFKILSFLLCFILLGATSFSQAVKPVKTTSTTKMKQPKFVVTVGSFKDTNSISVATAESVIGQPLKVTDINNNMYSVVSYEFLYKKIETSEDETTGKALRTSAIKSSRFTTTPLPQIWLDIIREQLRPTEELLYFNIIVKDKEGRNMYAPNVKFNVK